MTPRDLVRSRAIVSVLFAGSNIGTFAVRRLVCGCAVPNLRREER